MKEKTTHIRIKKSTLDEMKKTYPGMSVGEIVGVSWNTHKGIQKAGQIIYGSNLWKKIIKK